MSRDPIYLIGVAIGMLLGVILRALSARHRTVVCYDAVDAEHGPVHVEVTANRITGNMTRRVYERRQRAVNQP